MVSSKRMLRLSSAQGKLATMLELKLAMEVQRIADLDRERVDLAGALEQEGVASAVARSSALRRLALAGELRAERELNADVLRQQLALARGRQNILERRGDLLQSEADRREETIEGLEAALEMDRKGSGKR